MNWKSTVLVSGAGLLATWLANVPAPAPARQAATPAASPATAQVRVSDEIQQLADRLERRSVVGAQSDVAARNPFQFGRAPRPSRSEPPPTLAPVAADVPQATEPVWHLSGVAMDLVGEQEVWTAILSLPSGLVLARGGDTLPDGWNVSAIGAESVTLIRTDGSTMTLPLTGK
jgi:hypothetical protein